MFLSYGSFETYLFQAFSSTTTSVETLPPPILSSSEAVLRATNLSKMTSSDVKNNSCVGENWFLVIAELAQVIDNGVTCKSYTGRIDRLGDIINDKCSYKEIYQAGPG